MKQTIFRTASPQTKTEKNLPLSPSPLAEIRKYQGIRSKRRDNLIYLITNLSTCLRQLLTKCSISFPRLAGTHFRSTAIVMVAHKKRAQKELR
jgi:hypothetical protein